MRLIFFAKDLTFESFFGSTGFFGSTFTAGGGEGEGSGVGSGVGLGLATTKGSAAGTVRDRIASTIPTSSTAPTSIAIILKRFFARSEPLSEREIQKQRSKKNGKSNWDRRCVYQEQR